jgi:putative glutamine amidotransferase
LKPRILVAGPDRQDGYLRTYVSALTLAGADARRAWPVAGRFPGSVGDWLAEYDGVVLPGGVDVMPSLYGEEPHPMIGDTDEELDRVQVALANHALATGFPLLAICRGAQVLGVAAGGTLYQDLPSQRPSVVNHQIREPKDALAHEVKVDAASQLAGVTGLTRFSVNSRHHQAVRCDEEWLGPLRVVARAPDGLVEAVEHPMHPFLIGVQWHPENLAAGHVEALALFRGFVVACGHATCSVRPSAGRCGDGTNRQE